MHRGAGGHRLPTTLPRPQVRPTTIARAKGEPYAEPPTGHTGHLYVHSINIAVIGLCQRARSPRGGVLQCFVFEATRSLLLGCLPPCSGADDNGSGMAVVMHICEILAKWHADGTFIPTYDTAFL